jgi:hypothetical protein
MRKKSVKIFSVVLLYAYICLLALSVFHFHPTYFGDEARLLSAQNSNTYFDPFQSANSECAIVQLAATIYIHECTHAQTTDLQFGNICYNYVEESNKSLLIKFDAHGLRAPPVLS